MAKIGNNVEILANIPFVLEADTILGRLHSHSPGQRFAENIRALIEIVAPIARPKAIYKVSCVAKKEADSVEIDGVPFISRLIRINLDQVDTVFPYVATCGREVEAVEIPSRDILKRHCLEAIKMSLVISASMYLQEHLNRLYSVGELSNMSPGEIESWPITQQKELFSVIGDVEGRIGVKLTEGGAMLPIKSRSGFHYTTAVKFVSCLICTQKRCAGRQVAYDQELAGKYR
jgi:hypothetical protein